MSTTSLEQHIARELERVNDRIDLKIIKGRPYKKEALRHKELLVRLRQLRANKRTRTGLNMRVMPMWSV